MSLDTETRTRIEHLLAEHPVVLFMKGQPEQPMCGFSAAASAVLNDLLPGYHGVDVLSDPAIREGIKDYGQWPTIPQLYVKGELIGGADIIKQMYASGELHQLLGVAAPDRTVPELTLTDAAANAIREHLPPPAEGVLHLSIDGHQQAGFTLAPAGDYDIVAESNGIAIHMDPGSAKRARGVVIDWVKTVGGEGLALSFPGSVKSMSTSTLKARLAKGDVLLIDVRPAAARAQAAIAGAVALEEIGETELAQRPKDQAIVFHCHLGKSSRVVAERFVGLGFRDVYNLEGGIDAWSTDVDSSVPRY
ncbi:MAG TPA: Grx4 family monothiol glutaredoxin [Rhodanobacteraceae bacterium]|nr:Grx4 family monothiol glutaredoxin [Rhodanobacteraceae bacterium]